MSPARLAKFAASIVNSSIANAIDTMFVEFAEEPTIENFTATAVGSVWSAAEAKLGRAANELTERQAKRLEDAVRKDAPAFFWTAFACRTELQKAKHFEKFGV